MEPDFDPIAASGESNYNTPKLLVLNEVLVNGDADVNEIAPGQFQRKGGYLRKRVIVGKPRDQKPEEINLGTNASFIFLKVRRKLVERGDQGKIVLSTNEHNDPRETVDLYDDKGFRESRNAKAIREGYPGLRTVQIVYALLLDNTKEPELVRVVIKGASLGSDAKDKGATDFYDYLSSYTNGEHFWEYITDISTLLETGKKSYYCMNFTRGGKLDEGYLKLALEQMKKVHFNCEDVDKARSQKRSVDSNQRPTHEEDVPADEAPSDPAPAMVSHPAYPDKEVNPDDIPF